VVVPWSCAIELDREADRLAALCGSQDEVKIAGMKTEDNFPLRIGFILE
jgi:hypothetical protein